MVGREHMMRGELDVEFRSGGEYARAMRQWIGGAMDDVFAAEIREIPKGPDLDPKGIRSNVPCGSPGSLWGFCTITQRGARGMRDTARVMSEANLSWLHGKMADPAPFATVVGISRLGEDGRPHERLARITAEREESADAWVRLSCEMPEGSLRDERFREAFVRFMRDRAGQENPSFGHVA